jgi:hypothetical protein
LATVTVFEGGLVGPEALLCVKRDV